MFNYLKKDHGDTDGIVHWMSQMVLTRLPANEASGRVAPHALEGVAVPLLYTSSPGVVSWGFQRRCATPLSSWCLNSYLFSLGLEGRLLPWKPCKNRKQQGRGSFPGTQMVMCPAVPDASMSVGCCEGGDHVPSLLLSSCWRISAHTVWLLCGFGPPPCLPRPDERSKHPWNVTPKSESHKAAPSAAVSSFFFWVWMHESLQCLLLVATYHPIHLIIIILKVTNVYSPQAMLWANCLATVSLILYYIALM